MQLLTVSLLYTSEYYLVQASNYSVHCLDYAKSILMIYLDELELYTHIHMYTCAFCVCMYVLFVSKEK